MSDGWHSQSGGNNQEKGVGSSPQIREVHQQTSGKYACMVQAYQEGWLGFDWISARRSLICSITIEVLSPAPLRLRITSDAVVKETPERLFTSSERGPFPLAGTLIAENAADVN